MSLYLTPVFGIQVPVPAASKSAPYDNEYYFQKISRKIDDWMQDPKNEVPNRHVLSFDNVSVGDQGDYVYQLCIPCGDPVCAYEGICIDDPDIIEPFVKAHFGGDVSKHADKILMALDMINKAHPDIGALPWPTTPRKYFIVTS